LAEVKELRQELVFTKQALTKAQDEIAALKQMGLQRDARIVECE
jgi:hypothetical protein